MLSVQNSASSWTVARRFCEAESTRTKRWQMKKFGCLMCCEPTKTISHFDGLPTPTTAEFGLLNVPELSCKLHCTTSRSRCGVDLPHTPLSDHFSKRKCMILVLKLLAWQVRGQPICYWIIHSLADNHLLESATFMQKTLHPILQDKWKIS